MKIIRFLLLAVFAMPVYTSAQATYGIPMGNGFAWDTKIPVTFDPVAFNKNFAKQMSAVRAAAALQEAPKTKEAPQPAAKALPTVKEEDYTQCAVCHEKILKSDGYQITPKRDWYVKKHSPCACQFYKGWKASEDTSFFQTAPKRNECELKVDSKYATHTCAVCGKPINPACGAISSWEDDQGKHYAHADCFDWQRHNAQKEALLKNLDITEADCNRYDRQDQERINAQKQLIEEMKASSQRIREQQEKASKQELKPAEAAMVEPVVRPFKKVQRDFQRFNRRYGKALHQAAKAQREGKELSQKQQKLLKDFESLRLEYERSSQAAVAQEAAAKKAAAQK